jgi:outer membrane protein assembly factor BamB
MSEPTSFDGRPPRSRLRAVAGVTALVVVLCVLASYTWRLYKTRYPNLLDSEAVNAEQVVVLKGATLAVAPAAGSESGWAQWRGPNRDGRAPAGPFRTDWRANPPRVLWSQPCGGGYSSPAVVGGRVYLQDYDGISERVLCLEATTGSVLWQHQIAADYRVLTMGYNSGPRASPTVADGALFAVGATGVFVCLDPPREPGKAPSLRWQHDLAEEFVAKVPGWGYASSPLIEGNTVLVQPGGAGGSVAAFDIATGNKKWTAETEPNGYSSPVAATCAGSRQVITVTGVSILGIRPDDGKVLWRQPWATSYNGNIATPVVVGDYVFVSSGYGKGCVLIRVEPDGPGVRADVVYFRKGRVMKNHFSTCVYRDGFLYGYDDETLKCVDLRKGEVVEEWVAKDDEHRSIRKGTVALADRFLVGITQSGALFLAEANSDEFRFLGQVAGVLEGDQCWAGPVIADGRIYLRDQTKIVCLDVRP